MLDTSAAGGYSLTCSPIPMQRFVPWPRRVFRILLLALPAALGGEASLRAAAPVLDAHERAAVIAGALRELEAGYVDRALADNMGRLVRAQLADGHYDSFSDPRSFAEELTLQLRGVCHDGHLRVDFRPSIPGAKARDGLTTEDPALAEFARETNYGFTVVQVLPGNVGLIDLTAFSNEPGAAETAQAAFDLLANVDALIIDLRYNQGGAPRECDRIASYFVPAHTHLYDIYGRSDDHTDRHSTLEVPGHHLAATTPVFILTSHTTYSCAEGFTYALRGLKRVTVVGETTGGGAHTVIDRRIDDSFTIRVPAGKVIVPTLSGDWEGTGIEPDVKTSATEALKTAHLLALDKLLAGMPPGPHRSALERTRNTVSGSKR